MEIKNSKVAYVQKSGILITDNSNVLIDSCEVTRCGLGAQFYGAIQLSLQNSAHACSPTISNSHIHHNDKQGITMANLFNYAEMAPTVVNNDISYNYTGLYLYNGEGYYEWNHIHHNFEANNANSGAGVMLYGSGADAVFTYNEINDNYTGFYLTDGATVNLGNLNNASSNDDGYNCIYDNIFYTGEEYTVYNASSMDVTAENTVWDDDPPIDVSIIDGNDNPAYGFVNYEPTLTPYAPISEITVSLNGNNVYIQFSGIAYPTFANFEGINIYRDDELIAQLTGGASFFVDPNPLPPGEYTYGAAIVYEGDHESTITEATIIIPHTLNPPQNANATSSGYVTWEAPEGGSTSPFLYYNIYLDECFVDTTTNLYYQLVDLISGQQYMIGLSVEYVAGESGIVEFELPFVNANDVTTQYISALSNYPNPFNPETTISFSLTAKDAKNAKIEIYNLKGQKIRQYSIFKNQSSIIWDGTDENNQPVSSGIYFYKLKTDNYTSTKKLLLMK